VISQACNKISVWGTNETKQQHSSRAQIQHGNIITATVPEELINALFVFYLVQLKRWNTAALRRRTTEAAAASASALPSSTSLPPSAICPVYSIADNQGTQVRSSDPHVCSCNTKPTEHEEVSLRHTITL
jgi:hypothetical protein